MVRIGFVGTGVIAWAHAIGLQAMIRAGVLDAAVVAVHDLDDERAAGFAAVNGAAVVPGVAEVLESCDAVWVCTPTSAHRAVVEAAAARGLPVFCEKPLAPDLAGAEALAATVAGAGVPAQVGLVLRSAPVFRALRDVLASGELGAPMTAIFRDDQYFPVQGLYGSTWRGDVEVAGGGCLIEHSIHDLDILRFCLGEVTEVTGRTANFSGHEGVEDLATVSLRFASGACAELVSVWHDILSRGSTRRVEVFCRQGMAWLDDDYLGPLHVQTSGGTEVRPCPPPGWVRDLALGDDEIGLAVSAYVEADRAFLDAVSSGGAPQPGFAEAVVAHRLVDAAYRSSAAGGTPVALA
ncbi:MAG TPA: Gfo/Idh/MocA family oxidoreductase [Acidimicrobiales bacterium]|nr:Gfo/Idh/MocA family oxidoreductase [Acidimicrobiales bacterium]